MAVAGRSASDPGGLYVVAWIEATREICALRSPLVPPWLRVAPESAFSSALLGNGAVVEQLGWADNREALDRALSGWERHMDQAESLGWVRGQLALAAAATQRETVLITQGRSALVLVKHQGEPHVARELGRPFPPLIDVPPDKPGVLKLAADPRVGEARINLAGQPVSRGLPPCEKLRDRKRQCFG